MTHPVRVPAALCGALALALVSPVALAKKKKKGGDAPAAEAAAPATNVPDDGDSKKFADALMAAKIEGFRPTDGEGAKFEYDTLSFDAGNTWKAAGFVEIMDEKMECSESGTWAMEPAESAKVATVSWKVTASDCPGVDKDRESRAVLTVGKAGIEDIKFR